MTTLLLATIGGHLTQLDELSNRLPADSAALWVTNANEQSTSMLADREVQFVPYVGVRSVADVLRCLPHAHRLMNSWRFTRAVSTGSGIALGYLPYLASRGVACHYIESATRVRGPSLTGQILQRIPGIATYTQYPHWASSRWRYGGSVFDGYEAVALTRELTDQLRVVVTAGTATEYPLRRLFERLAPLLSPGGQLHQATGRRPTVLWQTGDTAVDDLPISPGTVRPSLPAAELAAALAEADIVVSHAGTGSALAALRSGRFPILVARDCGHREAGDDHQLQLATELSGRGLALQRDVESITVDDLLATLSTTVRRTGTPPPFELREATSPR